ncbi:MAG: SusD/RagB family nutrient-binding outer membrane lipoprotein [Phormidesmis sp. FL-bin-119]|nr:SusD/RagB family nutrient-binding outer membrane lipoprotein [Pedobacter sp.]
MRNLSLKSIFSALVLVATLSSCTKELAELNKNPNAFESVNPQFLFTKAQLGAIGQNPGGNRFNIMQQLQQEATYSEVTAPGDKYFAEGNVRGNWAAFSGCLSQIQLIINEVKKDPASINKLAAARIWRVYINHQLTDLYGDIPYSEALKGLDGSYQPKYDLQVDIYKDMFKELEESAISFDASKTTFGTSDLFYDGNTIKWKKFAYSLMLRLGMRLTKIDPVLARTWVEKAIAGGPILDAADLARAPYADGGLASNRNPFSEHMRILDYVDGQNPLNVQGSKISQRFINHLKGNSTTTKDPRLNVIAVLWVKQPAGGYIADTATALQKGMRNAQFNGYPADFETYSEPNPNTVMRYDAPVLVITPAEVHFLLAEASIRGWYSGNAATSYSNGVRAAMAQWSLYGAGGAITTDKVNAYLVNNPFNSTGTFDDRLDQISTQKWVLGYLDQIENFANWRRTGFPVLIPTNYPGNLTGGRIPRRFIVPESEETLNRANFLAAKARQSGDNTLLSRVWWDKE